jgi:hypothetical protein
VWTFSCRLCVPPCPTLDAISPSDFSFARTISDAFRPSSLPNFVSEFAVAVKTRNKVTLQSSNVMLVNDNSPLVRFPELQSDVVSKYANGVDADTLANTITFFGIHSLPSELLHF